MISFETYCNKGPVLPQDINPLMHRRREAQSALGVVDGQKRFQ